MVRPPAQLVRQSVVALPGTQGYPSPAIRQSSARIDRADRASHVSDFIEMTLDQLKSGALMMVSERRRNGLILFKEYYAEFAGPGAVVGGDFDMDCSHLLPVGNLSLLVPEEHEDRQRAFKIRRQWIRLTQQITDYAVPLQRAQMILNQFETYFDSKTVEQVPDEAFALLVGVLPHTVRLARRPPGQLNVKVKT